jgi:hypothetical protein
MNCKPGDLAVFVKSSAGNEGRLVTCLRFIGRVPDYRGSDYWETDTPVPSWFGDMASIARDSQLRPIRPGGVTDEEVRDLYAPDRSMKDSPASDTTSPNEKREVA